MNANTVASNYESLPAELRERPQWLIASPDKIPLYSDERGTLHAASATKPAHWMTFETASRIATGRGLRVGFALSADDPFTCIDFDVKPETLPDAMEWFWEMVQCWDSYTELSAGGKGLHLWVRGKIGAGRRRFPLEVYSQERFIISTGNPVIHSPIRDRQEWLTYFVDRYLPMGTSGEPVPDEPERRTDVQILDRICQSGQAEKFLDLWRGNWKAYGPSNSEGDAALLGILFCYTRNSAQLKRLFRMSPLAVLRTNQPQKIWKDDRYLDLTILTIRKQRAIDPAAIRLVLAAADGVIQEQYDKTQRQKAAREAIQRSLDAIKP